MKPKAVIIGAGLGGLTTALRLSQKGYAVEILEKYKQPGGRMNQLKKDGFTFDLAPTFFSMSYVFHEFAKECNIHFPCEFVELDPLYSVHFRGDQKKYQIYKDISRLAGQFKALEPDFERKMNLYLENAGVLFHDVENRIIQKNFNSLTDFLLKVTGVPVKHIPRLFRNMWKELGRYFTSYEVKVIFSLIAFFLGSTPFDTSAIYSILNYTELKHDGYYNVKGGMYKIIENLEKECIKRGVLIHYGVEIVDFKANTSVNHRLIDKNGKAWQGDVFVVNADAASFRGEVFKRGKYRQQRLDNMKWTLAPFTMYLGINGKISNIDHHNYFLGRDFEDYANKIFTNQANLEEPYYYVNVNSKFNPESAPEGCENLFILCPVADLRYKNAWEDREQLAETIISDLGNRVNYDLKENLITKVILDPADWEKMFNLYKGSGLGLAHNFRQIGAFRPANKDEVFKNVFYVGASTVPGTGLPMVVISSKLVTERIENEFGIVS